MTDRYTITELVMTKGTSAPVRVALLEMEKKIIALETENERLRETLENISMRLPEECHMAPDIAFAALEARDD